VARGEGMRIDGESGTPVVYAVVDKSRLEGTENARPKGKEASSYETTHAQVLLNDDIWHGVSGRATTARVAGLPLTAPMTNRIWVVSVAQVKWV
jgi:hypothetical protein